jgi:predicted kinase
MLILIRGLPGSGKSTLAKKLCAEDGSLLHVEADDLFVNEKGEYEFRPALLKLAHKNCFRSAENRLWSREGGCVVANTFTTYKEIQPYMDLAARYYHKVRIIECVGDYGSIHNVPKETIDRMKARWQVVDELCWDHVVYTVEKYPPN